MQDCPCVPKITAEGRMRQKTQQNASLPFEISEIQVDRQPRERKVGAFPTRVQDTKSTA